MQRKTVCGIGAGGKNRCQQNGPIYGRPMGGNLVRELRQALYPGDHRRLLQELHRQAHRAQHRQNQTQQAHHTGYPEVLQQSQDQGPSQTLRGHERPEPQQQNHPRPPRHAPAMPGSSGAGTAYPVQPCRRMQAPAQGKERDADASGGEDQCLPRRR